MEQVVIEGRLVRLRAFEPSDAALSYERINDPEVCRWLARRYPLSMADQDAWMASGSGVSYTNAKFAITVKADGRFVGGCDLRCESPENQTAGLGIAISDKALWNQGYGTDAMVTLCRFGFDEMNLERIELWVHDGNDRARHVYESIGFVHEGMARDGWYQTGGYLGMHLMGCLRGELRDIS